MRAGCAQLPPSQPTHRSLDDAHAATDLRHDLGEPEPGAYGKPRSQNIYCQLLRAFRRIPLRAQILESALMRSLNPGDRVTTSSFVLVLLSYALSVSMAPTFVPDLIVLIPSTEAAKCLCIADPAWNGPPWSGSENVWGLDGNPCVVFSNVSYDQRDGECHAFLPECETAQACLWALEADVDANPHGYGVTACCEGVMPHGRTWDVAPASWGGHTATPDVPFDPNEGTVVHLVATRARTCFTTQDNAGQLCVSVHCGSGGAQIGFFCRDSLCKQCTVVGGSGG